MTKIYLEISDESNTNCTNLMGQVKNVLLTLILVCADKKTPLTQHQNINKMRSICKGTNILFFWF